MSEHKTNKPTVTVVETPTRLGRLRAALPQGKTLKRLTLVIVALLVIGGGVSLVMARQAEERAARQQAEAAKPKKLSEKDYDTALTEKQAVGDFAGEVKLAEQQADDSMQRQLTLASAYANNKQYDKSLAIYDAQSDKGVLTANMYMAAGNIAVQAGQKERAIAFYEKGITQANKEKESSVLWETNVERFNQKITELRK